MHHASTVAMRDALLGIYGRMWDSWGHEMDTFWSSYCDDPWCCWSLCDCGLIMLATPSNQTQESWHREILRSRIPSMFKCSTEKMLGVALPQLVRVDGYYIPTELCFHVPAVSIDICM